MKTKTGIVIIAIVLGALGTYAVRYSSDRAQMIVHNQMCEHAYAGRVANGTDDIAPAPCVFEIIPPTLWERVMGMKADNLPQFVNSGCDQSATTTDCSTLPVIVSQIPKQQANGSLWSEYTNEEVGISLSYPAGKDNHGNWRSVGGETGKIFGIGIKLPSGAFIAGTAMTADFTAPKGGVMVPTEGFVSHGGAYYTLRRGVLSDTPFIPDEVWKLEGGAVALVQFAKDIDPYADYPEPPAKAVINLSGALFTGIGFTLAGSQPITPEDIALFKRIITSVRGYGSPQYR